MKPITPPHAKNKKGHYVPGMLLPAGAETLYISGQLSISPADGRVPETFEDEVRQALCNLGAVLEEAGLQRSDVALCRIYISSMEYWDRLDQIYGDWFGSHRPARAVVPCGPFHYGCNVEIEAVAVAK